MWIHMAIRNVLAASALGQLSAVASVLVEILIQRDFRSS